MPRCSSCQIDLPPYEFDDSELAKTNDRICKVCYKQQRHYPRNPIPEAWNQYKKSPNLRQSPTTRKYPPYPSPDSINPSRDYYQPHPPSELPSPPSNYPPPPDASPLPQSIKRGYDREPYIPPPQEYAPPPKYSPAPPPNESYDRYYERYRDHDRIENSSPYYDVKYAKEMIPPLYYDIPPQPAYPLPKRHHRHHHHHHRHANDDYPPGIPPPVPLPGYDYRYDQRSAYPEDMYMRVEDPSHRYPPDNGYAPPPPPSPPPPPPPSHSLPPPPSSPPRHHHHSSSPSSKYYPMDKSYHSSQSSRYPSGRYEQSPLPLYSSSNYPPPSVPMSRYGDSSNKYVDSRHRDKKSRSRSRSTSKRHNNKNSRYNSSKDKRKHSRSKSSSSSSSHSRRSSSTSSSSSSRSSYSSKSSSSRSSSTSTHSSSRNSRKNIRNRKGYENTKPRVKNKFYFLEIYKHKNDDPERPDSFSLGKLFKVECNQFILDVSHIIPSVQHYVINVECQKTKARRVSEKLRYSIYDNIVEYIRTLYKGKDEPPDLIFDGVRNVYTKKLLPLPENIYETDMKVDIDKLTRLFHVKMTLYAKDIDMTVLKNNPKQTGEFPIFQYSILDSIFLHYNSKMYMRIGAKYFDPSDRLKLINNTEVYRGFSQVTHLIQNGNSVNIDNTSGIFIENIPVSKFIERVLNGYGRTFDLKRYEDKEGNCCLDLKQIRQLKGELLSYKVICKHQGFNREYKINDISQYSACETKFKDNKGNSIYIIDYFLSQYNIKLKYPSLPCLIVGNNKVAMPMELCLIKDRQKRRKKISDALQVEMVQKTSIKPSERRKVIMNILKANEKMYSNIEKETGIHLINKFTECNARKLDEPFIRYANKDLEPNNGGWNQKGIELLKPVKIRNWAVINYDYQFDCKYYLDSFINAGLDMGIDITSDLPKIYKCDIRYIDSVKDKFKEILSNDHHCQLVVVYIPTRQTDVYGYIKKASDYYSSIPSQVMVTKNLIKGGVIYLSNVWLKINAKLGGINFTSIPPEVKFKNPLKETATCLMGGSILYPSLGVNCKSIASVVCSTDLEGLRVASEWRCQDYKSDIIQDLDVMCLKMLKNFIEKTGVIPKRVIFYRNITSVCQKPLIHEEEIPMVLQAIDKVFKKEKVKLTFLLVCKRHHVRFFCDDNKFTDYKGNIKSGAVIDNSVCSNSGYDWYCYSHGGLQGTSKPTLYDVLYDEVKWDPNDLYLTTYWQCFTFIRSTKAVSIPPMAYYAYLTSFRARYLTKRNDVNDNMGYDTDERVILNPRMYNVMYYI